MSSTIQAQIDSHMRAVRELRKRQAQALDREVLAAVEKLRLSLPEKTAREDMPRVLREMAQKGLPETAQQEPGFYTDAGL